MRQNQRDTRRYSPRHYRDYRDRKRHYADTWSAIGPLGYFILILVYTLCVVVSVLLLVQPEEKYDSASYSAVYTPNYTTVPAVSDAPATETNAIVTPSPGAAPGTLLESGSNSEDNFYAVFDRTGSVTDFTGSTFVLRGYISGNTAIPDLTVHYNPDTVVKKATVYSDSDTYEMYASSLKEFEDSYSASQTGIMAGVIFENPDAQEPQAKEIRFYTVIISGSDGAAGNQGAMTASPTPLAQTGTLLESGSGLNDNFYGVHDYMGTATDLTGSTFMMGKAGQAFDGNGNVLASPVTLHYGEDTVVKKATLHYDSDTYEMYASSLDEFVNMMNSSQNGIFVVVYLENPDSAELWVKEIRIQQ